MTSHSPFGLRLERLAVHSLRALRDSGYRLLDPAAKALRLARGLPAMPPLSLRRHAGPVRAFENSTRDLFALLSAHGLLREGVTILDLGCGPGAVPLLLEREGPAPGRYLGIDVHERSIAWCRCRFGANTAFSFDLARVASPYGSSRVPESAAYRFPVGNGTIDLVLAKSLFTHLLADISAVYLREIRRSLSPAGRGVLTAFVFGGNPPMFPFHGPDPRVRWRQRAHPHAAVAYERAHFEEMLAGAGLEIDNMIPGFWPGTARAITGQDTYIVR